MKTKLKKKLRAVLSITVILSLLLAAFAPIEAAALHELTGFADGTVVRFKNVATNGYLNLSRANDANGANVNIFEYDGTPEETWKLRYDATDDCYRIGSMVSSSGNNRVVDVKRGGEAPVHGCNVQLYTATDDTSQQWCFAYYGSGRYYIWLLACSGLALTASTVQSSAGTYNGTPTGTSTTSPGNVYLGSLPGYDSSGNYYGGPNATTIPDNQLWVIEEVNPTRTIADGVYTIKNMASQKMMDATSAGNVVSWGSHGGNNQKWKVTYDSDGFYTIQPMSDLTKYLCTERLKTDEMGANIGIEPANIYMADRNKWKIIPNDTGSGYRITCKAGYYAHAATVLEGNTANGANVVQVEYCNAASQQWVFTAAYTVNLEIIYDNAYLSRFPNAVSRINSQMETLQNKFLDEFGIWIKYNAPTKFTSYADSCSTSPTAVCSHSTDSDCANSVFYLDGRIALQSYHHNNITNILGRISLPDMSKTFKMAYIGHSTCAVVSGEHALNPYAGLSYSELGICSVMKFTSVESETKTMVHEFGHIYGAPDHYGYGTPTTDEMIATTGYAFNRNCIYGEYKDTESVVTNLTICNGCIEYVQNNRTAFDHFS